MAKPSGKSTKVALSKVVEPHKKRKIIRSQMQGLSQMARGIEEMDTAQIKKTKMMIEADNKRDELFLKQILRGRTPNIYQKFH